MALQEELKEQGDFLFKHRSNLPLLLLIVGLLIKTYQVLIVEVEGETILSEILKMSSIFVGLFGLFIRIWTVGYTPSNTSGRNTNEGQVAETINKSGLYSLTRNPLYVGNYLMWLAIAMLTGNIWFVIVFSLVFWIYYERIVYAEENFLRNKFGSAYLDWAKDVAIFIPKNLKYKKSSISFSWKKVLKNEKNGLFALFLLFFIFETFGQWLKDGTFLIDQKWIIFGMVASGIIYLILKLLKNTSVLSEEGRN
ncbi:MAG: isoprenylcysteine carboxylmethyltransferase family protein [Crocinitomicaceae bacterium]